MWIAAIPMCAIQAATRRSSGMAEGITRHKYANIEVTPEQVTPLYDNLLVRRIDDKYDGIVLTSDMTQTKDGTWVKAPDHGPRKGVVVAVGRGDKIPGEWSTGPMEAVSRHWNPED